MFKFIHAADIHLDSPMIGLQRYESAPADEIRGSTRRALENLVTLAIEEEAEFVLIAGDLYDGDWKDYNTALFFSSQMSRLRKKNINVYVAAGNHDAASVITKKLNPPANVNIMSSKKVETVFLNDESRDLRVAIHGRSFSSREQTENVISQFPSPENGCFNVGLLHTSAEGSDRHTTYAPCSIIELAAKGYDYWALGHVHNRSVLSEAPYIVFPGNTQGRHIRETGPKGCTIISVDDNRILSIEHRDLDVVRWFLLDVDATGTCCMSDVIDRVSVSINESLSSCGDRLMATRINLFGTCAAHDEITKDLERFTNEIYQVASDVGYGRVWIEKIKIGTRMKSDINALAARDDATGAFLKSLQNISGDDEELVELLRQDIALKDLFTRLPSAVKEDDDTVDLSRTDSLGEMIEEAKQILITRVFERRDDE